MNYSRTDDTVPQPYKKHKEDAGYDLYALEDFTLKPGRRTERLDLGVSFEIPPGFCGMVIERSSQGAKGIFSTGPLVDSGYSGTVHVTLVNTGAVEYVVKKGDRICQIVFVPIRQFILNEVPTIAGGERGAGAHGSTGV